MAPRRRNAALAALAVFSALACDPEVQNVAAATQLNVQVEASEEVRTLASELRASLSVRVGDRYEPRSQARVGLSGARWPLDIPVVAARERDEAAAIEVVIDAYQGDTWLAQTRVLTAFVPRKHVWVKAPTMERCAASCAPPACQGIECGVCSSGSCVAVVAQLASEVAPSDLPVEMNDDAGTETGSPDPDGATDSVAPDASLSEDAGVMDGASANQPPMPDAASGPGPNDAAPAGDAGDAGARADAPADAASDASSPPVVARPMCAADSCPAPYPCVPTSLGYTCRGLHADWPMPDPVAGAKVAPNYTSNGDTVVDTVTKLEWQIGVPEHYPECTVINNEPVGGTGLPGQLCTRSEARRYCDALVHDGKDDWRLPSLIEYATLLDGSRAAGRAQTNTMYFGEVSAFNFITDSLSGSGPTANLGINFYIGATFVSNGYAGKVRCVRGGVEPPFATPAERYAIDAASGTVTDRATGLVWQRSVAPKKYTEDEAIAACTNGFRMPTPNELLTILDPTRAAAPTIDPVAFPNTPPDWFWAVVPTPRQLGVDFRRGVLEDWVGGVSGGAYVRCVR